MSPLNSRAGRLSRVTPGLLLGIGAFLALAFASAPTVGWRDSGQLGASAFTLGVPHPTGFPTYMMLGKLATLVPLGGVAFRLGLLSAACAALAAGLVAGAVGAAMPRDSTRGAVWVGAATAAIALLASRTVWLHATSIEVYAPSALALALGLRALATILRAPSGPIARRWALCFAAATGVASGVHVTVVLGLAVFWAALLVHEGLERGARAACTLLGAAAVLAALGALVYAYLPVATLSDPWRNWGDPSTLGRLSAHVSGASIREGFQETTGSVTTVALMASAQAYGEQLLDGVGGLSLLAVVGALGLLLLPSASHARERRLRLTVASALVGLWMVDAAFTVLVNPMGIVDRQTGVPSQLALSALAGAGAALLIRILGRVAPGRMTGPLDPRAWAVAVVVALALAGARAFDERPAEEGSVFAELLGRDALAALPPGGVAFTSGDDASGVLTYLLGVEGARPDVAHISLGHLYDARAIAHWGRLYGPGVVPEAVVAEAQRAEDASELKNNATQQRLLGMLVGALLERQPLGWEPGIAELDAVVEPLLRPGFPLWTLRREGAPLPYPLDAVTGARAAWARLAHEPPSSRADGALATSAREGALTELRRGRQGLATALLIAAVRLDPSNHRALSNLSVLRERAGAVSEALGLARRVVELRPDYHIGRRNLAGLLLRTGDLEGALAQARTALTLAHRPSHQAKTRILLARIALARGDVEAARAMLQEALEHAPGHREATELLRSCCE